MREPEEISIFGLTFYVEYSRSDQIVGPRYPYCWLRHESGNQCKANWQSKYRQPTFQFISDFSQSKQVFKHTSDLSASTQHSQYNTSTSKS